MPDHTARLSRVMQLRVTDEAFTALALLSEQRGEPMSTVARSLIEHGLNRFTNDSGVTLLEALATHDRDVVDELIARYDELEN